MNKPIAVLISDIHYNLQTLPLADAAMRQAIAKANELDVPLIVAGDLHDTKANMRAECVNVMRETFSLCRTLCFILRGNHDQINERSKEHALNFLEGLGEISDPFADYNDDGIRPAVRIIDSPGFVNDFSLNRMSPHLIPYHHDANELRNYLKIIDKNSLVIMHQGLNGSESGDYIQDKSALEYEDAKDFRVISGHYHKRQDIKTGPPRKGAVGLFSYIGNPFSLGFGEANDPPKGFQILMDDGTLEFVPTNLRKHVIIDVTLGKPIETVTSIKTGDLVWWKIRGPKEKLMGITKQNWGIQDNARLDLIPIDTTTEALETKDRTDGETLDALIDSLTNTSDERKARLKELWKNSICE